MFLHNPIWPRAQYLTDPMPPGFLHHRLTDSLSCRPVASLFHRHTCHTPSASEKINVERSPGSPPPPYLIGGIRGGCGGRARIVCKIWVQKQKYLSRIQRWCGVFGGSVDFTIDGHVCRNSKCRLLLIVCWHHFPLVQFSVYTVGANRLERRRWKVRYL